MSAIWQDHFDPRNPVLIVIRCSASPPHVHKHRLHGVPKEEGPETNTFRNDEAFERYEMGGAQPHEKGSKVRNQAEADYMSIKHSEYNLALVVLL